MVATGQKEVIWAQALPRGTFTQRAEILALKQALKWDEKEKVNTYTDNWYAFAPAHVHGQIYRLKDLLTSERKTIKNKKRSSFGV